jgi:ElaB/YqjD/DUF883 family membrane-anchored ribosome-binding protein
LNIAKQTFEEKTVMASIPKGNSETGADVQAIMNDLASLRDDIAKLTKHVGNNAYEAGNAAADQIGNEAAKVYDNISAQGQRSAKKLGQQVEDQPLTALLIAFAIGFVGSRILSR